MRTELLDYHLPPEQIADHPTPERDGARMLRVDRTGDGFVHGHIRDLPAVLSPGTLLVVNDTRVIPARLRGTRATGGKVEVLLVRALDASARHWIAMGRASKALRPGTVVTISDALTLTIDARFDDGLLRVSLACNDPWKALDAHGEVPLPPYIRRAPTPDDRLRYQTVYADRPGAIAAPTAGLHLSQELLNNLTLRGVHRAPVTLHVGPGTFAPVAVDDLDEHPMHAEWYDIPASTVEDIRRTRAAGMPVVAVGTTVVRALESWGGDGATTGETRLLIQPGYSFRVVDGLLTNFHLPRSTLLALVMAFGGVARVQAAYATAVAAGYRFYSYGDAMLLQGSP